MIRSKSFKFWKTQELHNTFGIARTNAMSAFTTWLAAELPISTKEKERLEELRIKAGLNIDYWNEEELKMNFIGPLMDIVDLNGANYRTFYDRPVSVTVNDVKLYGKLDGVVANGFQEPETPYFCLHEYKQENNREGDPKGQLLAGMLAVQALNNTEQPIFGCSVLARGWYFVLLQGKNYGMSDVYAATHQDDLLQIFSLLRYVKAFIEREN
jgi:hypothetical protein